PGCGRDACRETVGRSSAGGGVGRQGIRQRCVCGDGGETRRKSGDSAEEEPSESARVRHGSLQRAEQGGAVCECVEAMSSGGDAVREDGEEFSVDGITGCNNDLAKMIFSGNCS